MAVSLLGHPNRGEKAASAMENQLTSLEQKIENLLASIDRQEDEDEEGGKRHLEMGLDEGARGKETGKETETGTSVNADEEKTTGSSTEKGK